MRMTTPLAVADPWLNKISPFMFNEVSYVRCPVGFLHNVIFMAFEIIEGSLASIR